MVDGIRGGRSTHGICYGVLAWLIEDGNVGGVDVSGLASALAVRYDDDEPGSPWTIVLHVDATGDEQQRAALADVFLGRLGGPHVGVLPWVRKASNLVDIRADRIELDAGGRRLPAAGRRRRARTSVSSCSSGQGGALRDPGLRRAGPRAGRRRAHRHGRSVRATSSPRTARSRVASPTRPSKGYLPP